MPFPTLLSTPPSISLPATTPGPWIELLPARTRKALPQGVYANVMTIRNISHVQFREFLDFHLTTIYILRLVYFADKFLQQPKLLFI